jgi:hypothetical protein
LAGSADAIADGGNGFDALNEGQTARFFSQRGIWMIRMSASCFAE